MIRELEIINFKSLNNIKLTLGNFNLLCGTNSSGKTSIIHAILLLAQNSNNKSKYEASLNGKLLQLGEFTDIKNFKSIMNKMITIKGILCNNDYFYLNLTNNLNDQKYPLIKSKRNVSKFLYETNIFYLSANRIGIEDIHVAGSFEERFGINGEFTIDYLNRNKEIIIQETCVHSTTKSTPPTLLNEVDYWLSKITGTNVEVTGISNSNKSIATFANVDNNKFVRAVNTGSGISYLISIIITCFGVSILSEGNDTIPIVIIENPEIHLHPKAQSLLTEFLIFMSKGMQIIVETQSDHVFNRFRIELRNNNSDNQLGSVYFLNYDSEETKANHIRFTSDGRIINHQRNLFDQFDADLLKLLG